MNSSRSLQVAVKSWLKRALGRLGFYLGRYPNAHTLEAHLAHVFSQLGINTVLDVGAHHGEFGEELRRLGYQGRIVSFEPVPENFAILQQQCDGDKLWQAYPYALGAENGTAEIKVLSGSTFTSFLEPNEFGREHFASKMKIEKTVSVEVRRLDGIMDECVDSLDQDQRVFLKMDTQGFDLEVLKGAAGVLDCILALQTELSVQPIYKDMATGFADMLPFINDQGFDISGLYPVTRHPDDQLRVVEFDCVMCRAPETRVLTDSCELATA